jgi:hypothetical protein
MHFFIFAHTGCSTEPFPCPLFKVCHTAIAADCSRIAQVVPESVPNEDCPGFMNAVVPNHAFVLCPLDRLPSLRRNAVQPRPFTPGKLQETPMNYRCTGYLVSRLLAIAPYTQLTRIYSRRHHKH